MLTMAKILLPVDFSERCFGAARHAIRLARQFQSEITVLHVLVPHLELGSVEVGSAVLTDLIEERQARARQRLDTFACAELAQLRVKRVLLEGDPAKKIVEYANTQEDDLIIMPTHGRGAFRRLLLGSVTAKVLHDADCPVWTGVHFAPQMPDAMKGLSHVLCAVNPDAQAERVLHWACGLAGAFGARLTVVHAVTALDPRTESYYSSPEWRAYLIDAATADIDKLRQKFAMDMAIEIKVGEASVVITAEAERLEADVVVIGRGSASEFHGRLHSNAYAVIRSSPCPVASL